MPTYLHISTRLILGGSQENTVLSCMGQARLGHAVHLAFGPIYGPEGSLLAQVQAFNARCAAGDERTTTGLPCAPIGLHEVPNLCRQVSPLRDARALGELETLIRRLDPAVVHTHSSKAGILGRWAAWRIAQGQGKPTIVHTIHGPPFMPIEGSAVQRLKTHGVNYAYTLAERFAARRCHAIASVAQAMTDEFLARNIGRPGQYATVYSGMDVEAYLPPADYAQRRASLRQALGLGAGDFVIGTVARLAEHKGHDDLLDALAPHLKARPKWKLLWVGDGWWRPRLERRLEALGLRTQVVLTGLVPSERVAEHLWTMDVLAHPSTREGLPRTVTQALLAGVCPVAYDVNGTREVCIPNQTGRLITPGDTAGLGRAILDLYNDPHARQALAHAGQALCRQRFGAGRMVDALEMFYTQARLKAETGA